MITMNTCNIRGIPQAGNIDFSLDFWDVTRLIFSKKIKSTEVTRLRQHESTDFHARKSIDRFLLFLSSGCAQPQTTLAKPLMNVINHYIHVEGEGIDVYEEVIYGLVWRVKMFGL
jgi:hypothetical protein